MIKITGWRKRKIMQFILGFFFIWTMIAITMLFLEESKKNQIQIGDIVRCGDLVTHQYDGVVTYKIGNGISLSGTHGETMYHNPENCPIASDEYGNCVWAKNTTGEWEFDIIYDECFRPNNKRDLILRYQSRIQKE